LLRSVNLFFDLDGTLVDPREGIFSSLKFAFSSLGREVPTESQLEDAIGPPIQVSFASFLDTDDQRLIWQAVNAYREHFAGVGITGNVVYEGMTDALELLRIAGARLFVATSKPVVFASEIIRQHGLSGYFQAVYGSELDGTRSDKGELIAHVLASEILSAGGCQMIGDRKHDMIGALKNSVRPVGVLWGFGSRSELMEAGAEQLLEYPANLAGLPR